MKLFKLNVMNLYGYYNYEVKFNSDVTFIFGSNGSGKTTILNITEAIITGQMYKLFQYNFEEIILEYGSSTDIKSSHCIRIERKKDQNNSLVIFFLDREYNIEYKNFREEFIHASERENREIQRFYFSNYEFLKEIRDTFNYVYLPLNRVSASYTFLENQNYLIMNKRNRIINQTINDFGFEVENRDATMMYIENLIQVNYSKINSQISKYNDEFRNDILKSLLEVNRSYDISQLFEESFNKKDTLIDLQKTRDAYIKMLKDLKLIDKIEEKKYESFFSELIKRVTELQKSEQKTMSLNIIAQMQEVSKIKKLVQLAKDSEKKKNKANQPIETFIDTMNQFVYNSEDEKRISMDSLGNVHFYTKENSKPISIHYLSSGEKQLITFFANLIFNVKDKKSGIFVVDEPELSLHLSWQRIFIEKTLEINKNIQLIFATHAPEIIGHRRDKMYRLEKKYVEKN